MSTPRFTSEPFTILTKEEANSIAAAHNPLVPFVGIEESAAADFHDDVENGSATINNVANVQVNVVQTQNNIQNVVFGQRPVNSRPSAIVTPFDPRHDRLVESEEVNSSRFSISDLRDLLSIVLEHPISLAATLAITTSIAFNYEIIKNHFYGSSVPVVSAPANSAPANSAPATVSASEGVDMNRVFIPKFNAYGEPLSKSYKAKIREGVKTCGDKFVKMNPNDDYQIVVSSENFIATITVPTFGANGEVVGQKPYPLYTTGFKCTTK